jgi:hypothetical protein
MTNFHEKLTESPRFIQGMKRRSLLGEEKAEEGSGDKLLDRGGKAR